MPLLNDVFQSSDTLGNVLLQILQDVVLVHAFAPVAEDGVLTFQMLLLHLVKNVLVSFKTSLAPQLTHPLLGLVEVTDGHAGLRFEQLEFTLKVLELHLGVVDATSDLVRHLPMVALGNRHIVSKTVQFFSLFRGSLRFIDDALGLRGQLGKLLAGLYKLTVVTDKFTGKKLVFFLTDEASLEVLDRLAFGLLELDLAGEIIVEHADLLKNLVDSLRRIVELGDLEQRLGLLLLHVLSLKSLLLKHVESNLTERDCIKFG